LKSISYNNLIRLDAAPKATLKLEEPKETNISLQIHSSAKRPQELATVSDATQVRGAGGKRCKMTESAIAGGDKVSAFVSAARNRDLPSTSESDNPVAAEAARSNALIYAKADVVSLDDQVATDGLTRLIQLCPRFAMKAICVLGLDVSANGSGKIGSKSSETIEGLATWLTGGESDGILRKQLQEGQACAGASNGISACRTCAERGLKGGRLLRLFRENKAHMNEFVGRGCTER